MDGNSVLKRPKPTDSEEELFRMQEEFLKNKQPSVKVINLKKSTKSLNTTFTAIPYNHKSFNKIKSKFSELKRLKTEDKICTSQGNGNIINPMIKETEKSKLQDSVQNITSSKIVIGNIVEKKYDIYEFDKKKFFCYNTGFPEVFLSTDMVYNYLFYFLIII